MKLKAYVHADYSKYSKKLEYTLYNQDMSSMNGFGSVVEVIELDFTPPPAEILVVGHVAMLREEKQKIRAKCETDVQKIDSVIGELLAIEDKS